MDAHSPLNLDVHLHQPVRTRIAAFLITRGEATFTEIKKELEITDGNLDAHLRKLITAGYIQSEKRSGQGRPQTFFSLSDSGITAFENYLEILKKLLNVRF